MKKMKLYYGLTTLFLLILLIAIFGLQTFCFERKEMNLPVFFLILIMLSNPIKNLFCVRQKIVKNSNDAKELNEIFNKIEDNYNIKITEYNKEMYKQGFIDGVNLILNCLENKNV